MLLIFIILITITAVSAHENKTLDDKVLSASGTDVKLEKTYYYDSAGNYYNDDTVVTHNVVKYYGDKDTKFRVKVYDDDHKPED